MLKIDTIINIVICIVEVAAMMVAIATLISTKKEYREGIARQKKEATLEAYNRLQEQVFDQINKYRPSEIKEICKDKKTIEYKILSGYLARIEQFCAGLECDIYDYDTFYAIAKGYFDDPKGILLGRLLPIIESKNMNQDKDYFANLHSVWNEMKRRSEEQK